MGKRRYTADGKTAEQERIKERRIYGIWKAKKTVGATP